MSTGPSQPAGWYHAQGDPPNTHRYWDGAQWVGGPQPIGGTPGGMGAPGGMGMPMGMPGGQVVAGGRSLAEPGTRIVARLIDLGIGLVAGLIIASIVGFDSQVGVQLMLGLVGIGYELAFTALKGGTPGKLIMGIGVTTSAGALPPGWGPAAIRWVVTAIPCIGVIVWIVSFVLLFTDPQHRTVGDRAANTFVVKTK